MRYILLFFLGIGSLSAQKWISKSFSYDSLYDVYYGSAENFAGGFDDLHVDVFTPDCNDKDHTLSRPFILFIHGGAFLAGTKYDQNIVYLCKQFAKRGYVTASLEYRLGFIADDTAHNCNYPNYNCVFAADRAEWVRAYYRGIQDAKGAIRYFVKNATQYGIDPQQIFLVGESAGGFVALGAGLMDDDSERPIETLALNEINKPADNAATCIYNVGKLSAAATIKRPDLGSINGSIEPRYNNYKIRAIGNMYGGMLYDLLKVQNGEKPGIYMFHQPCDIVVPIDSNYIYTGLSWCFTNGYGCYGITNTPVVFGSRAIKKWNDSYRYNYTIQAEFTATDFPYSFLFGDGSCADQVNKPCHAYDNLGLRENQLAAFFANYLNSVDLCQKLTATSNESSEEKINCFFNTDDNVLYVYNKSGVNTEFVIMNSMGTTIQKFKLDSNHKQEYHLSALLPGLYILSCYDLQKSKFQFIKF